MDRPELTRRRLLYGGVAAGGLAGATALAWPDPCPERPPDAGSGFGSFRYGCGRFGGESSE